MRKFLKNNILEIFQTMYKAHSSIKNLWDRKDFQSVQVLLADCQNAALQVGTIIENSEGKGFVTVGFLAEYCRALYEFSMSISDGKNCDDVQKALDEKLAAAENSVRNDIKVKLEIVFMPYKASMWDSLESIWKAADADPDCEAYVIPIPYYDRNPDHSFGTYHYEGRDFPDYVPITHYNEYDLGKKRPDVIYIHNPYDDCNYVTSVDPRFYSRELKKYTDMLVYVPYFVLSDISPYDVTGIKTMAHFCSTPGVFNSDKVVVQSENMKKIYNMVLSQADQRYDINYWENKILGLGSPKIDKAVGTAKEDVELPESWKRKIMRKDGTCKKIFFYNVSIGATLKKNECVLDKIRSVFRIFKNRSDDVVLLWRPHPLLKATIDSMIPQLADEYNEVVSGFISGDWGIFDDTPDLYRAIAISDAYYGDGSSLTVLFGCLGKPIMFQNTECNQADCADYIDYSLSIYFEDKIWLCSDEFNGLFCVDPVTMNVEYKGVFPCNLMYERFLFSDIKIVDNETILFVPKASNNIVLFNIKSSEFNCYDLLSFIKKTSGTELNFKFDQSYVSFLDVLIKDNKLFFVTNDFHSIIILDSDRKKLSLSSSDLFTRKNNNLTSEDIADICIAGNSIFCLMNNSSKLMVYDITRDEFSVKSVICDKLSSVEAIPDENYLWFAVSDKPNIIKMDIETCKCEKLPICFEGSELFCRKMAFYNGNLFLLSADEVNVYCFNPVENKIVASYVFDEISEISLKFKLNELFGLNKKIIDVTLPESADIYRTKDVYNIDKDVLAKYNSFIRIYADSDFCTLSSYLDYILSNEDAVSELRAAQYKRGYGNIPCGKLIYDTIKSTLRKKFPYEN